MKDKVVGSGVLQPYFIICEFFKNEQKLVI